MNRLLVKFVRKVALHPYSRRQPGALNPIRNMASVIASLFPRVCKPVGEEHAEYLKLHGNFHAIGDHCSILVSTTITDPDYVSIGNNVRLAGCSLFGHDGSIAMLNRAYGIKIDHVGKIVIHDNVFVGYHAKIMPGVTIGSNAIVAAGALVTKDVASGDVVGGVPARKIARVEDLVKKLQDETSKCPWSDLIEQREGNYDPEMEPELRRRRIAHFFPANEKPQEASPPMPDGTPTHMLNPEETDLIEQLQDFSPSI